MFGAKLLLKSSAVLGYGISGVFAADPVTPVHTPRNNRRRELTTPGAPKPSTSISKPVTATAIQLENCGGQCAICYGEMGLNYTDNETRPVTIQLGEESIAQPCGHCFHIQCVATWYDYVKREGRQQGLCPLCRHNWDGRVDMPNMANPLPLMEAREENPPQMPSWGRQLFAELGEAPDPMANPGFLAAFNGGA